MRHRASITFIVFGSLMIMPLSTVPAKADGECKLKGDKNFEIKPDQGPVTLNWVLENTGTCTVRVLLPADYAVNSIALQDQASNGSIKQLSQNVF